MNGLSFTILAYENKKKTWREKFLEEIDQVILRGELLKIVRKHHPKVGNGHQLIPLERMLQIYFMQRWYGLSDLRIGDALHK